MTDIEQILEDCLNAIESGAATMEECLARYPKYAAQLRPLLRAASRFDHGREVKPSPMFKANTRAKLTLHMKKHPRRKRGFLPIWSMAVSLAALMMTFVVTGTVYAQSALPGDRLYEWKLTSERAWRVVSSDFVGIDLKLADRRLKEYVAVSSDPVLGVRALKGYQEALSTLQSELNNDTESRIRPVLESHQQSLKNSGLTVQDLEDYLARKEGSVVPTIQVPTPAP